MSDSEKAKLIFEVVRPLRHLAQTLPAGSPEAIAAHAAADALQPHGSRCWALSRGISPSRIAALQGAHS